MVEEGKPKDEFNPTVARWFWWTVLAGLLGWLSFQLDWVQRVANTTDYWTERVADAKSSIVVSDYMLMNFKIDAERHRRTEDLDVAQAIESARLMGSDVEIAKKEALDEEKFEAEMNMESIKIAEEDLKEGRIALQQAEQGREEARNNPPFNSRWILMAVSLAAAALLWTLFFRTACWVWLWRLATNKNFRSRHLR